MKKLALLLSLFVPHKEGITLDIKRSPTEIFSVIVETLTTEGFVLKYINEQVGVVTFEPKTMPTEEFFTTVGIPGDYMMLEPNMNVEINLSWTVRDIGAETSTLGLKGAVLSISTESPSTGASGTYRAYYSGYALNHYFGKILKACGVEKLTAQ